jgi:hypothetical protein
LWIVIKDNYINVTGHRLSPFWKVSEKNHSPHERQNSEGTRTYGEHIKNILFIQYFVEYLFHKNRYQKGNEVKNENAELVNENETLPATI